MSVVRFLLPTVPRATWTTLSLLSLLPFLSVTFHFYAHVLILSSCYRCWLYLLLSPISCFRTIMQHQHLDEDAGTGIVPGSAMHAASSRIYHYCKRANALMFRLRAKEPRLPAKRVMPLYKTTMMRPWTKRHSQSYMMLWESCDRHHRESNVLR